MSKSTETYHPLLKTLHWFTVVLLVGTSVLGFYFSDMPRGAEKSELLRLHASVGLLVLAAFLARLATRWLSKVPPPLESESKVQNRAASGVHMFLYLSMVLLVLAGMFALFTVGWGVPFFGLFEVPTMFAARDMELHHLFEEIHVATWWVLTALVAAHVGAALHHRFIKGDATLARMWFRRAR